MPGLLASRLLELHRELTRHEIPHAFGGAIALAYWTLDPRGTSDLDVNVFVPHGDAARALAALPAAIEQPPATEATIVRDGQVRLWWEDTPIDLFFNTVPVHEQAAKHARTVRFADHEIPVLGPIELVVFKAMFDRTKDRADIEAVVAAGAVDLDAVRATLAGMLASDDVRFARLDEAIRRGTDAADQD